MFVKVSSKDNQKPNTCVHAAAEQAPVAPLEVACARHGRLHSLNKISSCQSALAISKLRYFTQSFGPITVRGAQSLQKRQIEFRVP